MPGPVSRTDTSTSWLIAGQRTIAFFDAGVPGANVNLALAAHGVTSVQHEIGEHLGELRFVGEGGPEPFLEVEVRLDRRAAQRKTDDALEQGNQVDPSSRGCAAFRESGELRRERARSLTGVLEVVE